MTDSGRRYSYLTSEFDALYHEAAQNFGLPDSALRILYMICLVDGVYPLSEIIRLPSPSKQTVNSSLRNLEKDGVLYLKATGGKKEKCLSAGEQSAMQIIEIEIENAILFS